MRNLNEDTITQAVLARHAEMPNERFRQYPLCRCDGFR